MPTIIQLLAQWLTTAFDFLLIRRPKQFFALREANESTYANPYLFLAANLILAGIALATALTWNAQKAGGGLTRTEACVIFASIAAVHGLVSIGFGYAAAWLLNERTEVSGLAAAFCYTSVLYPVLGVLMAVESAVPARYLELKEILPIILLQCIAMGYLLNAMARVSHLHGRRLLAYVTVTSSFVLVLFVLGAAVIMPRLDEYRDRGPAITMVSGAPVATLTLGPMNVTSTSAQVMGASAGAKTAEWFEFGETQAMQFSVDAHDAVGLAQRLEPAKRYYFRYVTQHGGITCYGDVKSFKTLER